MEEPTLNDVLIALARLETKQDQLMQSVERLRSETDTHWKKIADIERKLAVLEERQGPKVHWVTWLVAVIAFVGLVLGVLDRIYVNGAG